MSLYVKVNAKRHILVYTYGLNNFKYSMHKKDTHVCKNWISGNIQYIKCVFVYVRIGYLVKFNALKGYSLACYINRCFETLAFILTLAFARVCVYIIK